MCGVERGFEEKLWGLKPGKVIPGLVILLRPSQSQQDLVHPPYLLMPQIDK